MKRSPAADRQAPQRRERNAHQTRARLTWVPNRARYKCEGRDSKKASGLALNPPKAPRQIASRTTLPPPQELLGITRWITHKGCHSTTLSRAQVHLFSLYIYPSIYPSAHSSVRLSGLSSVPPHPTPVPSMKSLASSMVVTGPSVPGTTGTPSLIASSLAEVLSPVVTDVRTAAWRGLRCQRQEYGRIRT